MGFTSILFQSTHRIAISYLFLYIIAFYGYKLHTSCQSRFFKMVAYLCRYDNIIDCRLSIE